MAKTQKLTEQQREELARFVEKMNTLVASEQQELIFARAKTNTGRYVINAGPGSGKTTTAIKLSTYFTDNSSIYFSFNKKIQVDTSRKLDALGSKMIASTVHSFGLQCMNSFFPSSQPCQMKDSKYSDLIEAKIARYWNGFFESIKATLTKEQLEKSGEWLYDVQTWSKTLIKYHQLSLSGIDPISLKGLIEQFDLTEMSHRSPIWPFVVATVVEAIDEGKSQFWDMHLIDFNDMIYYPAIFTEIPVPTYKHIIIDEAQDTSETGLTLILRACDRDTQVFAVGDPRQCQPAGTMVRMKNGQDCPIEDLQIGDQVVTFDRRSAAFVRAGRVNDIASRHYDGLLYTIIAGCKKSLSTDSHKWLIRWTNTEKPAWITYVMKKGDRYRVGQTQLFHYADGYSQFGLATRARVEKADAAWILKVHASLEDAITHEAIVAARYGLPQIVFNHVWDNIHLTQKAIDTVYSELYPLERKAVHCLIDHGRRVEYPIYKRNDRNEESEDTQQRQGRKTLFETQACNLISEYMAVPLAPEPLTDIHQRVEWKPATTTSEMYSGTVYSLDIERHHKYIADGIVTCNSIYVFAGAKETSIPDIIHTLNAEVLPLRTCYRCGSRIVDLANQLDGQLVAAGNHEGTVKVIPSDEYLTQLQPKDAVIGRTTARLVKDCLRVLQTGKRAIVLGKNIGDSISGIITKIEARHVSRGISALAYDLSNFVELVDEYAREQEKLISETRKKNPDLAISEMHDRVDTAKAFYEAYVTKCMDASERRETDPQCEYDRTARDFKRYIKGLFTDDENASIIQFMTAHRSKGLEFERVFIIGTDEFPHPKAKSDQQQRQETNVMYVAITRAINDLYFVDAPFTSVNVPDYNPHTGGLTIISAPQAGILAIYSNEGDGTQSHNEKEPSIYDALGFEDYDPAVVDTLFHDSLGIQSPLHHDKIQEPMYVDADEQPRKIERPYLTLIPPQNGEESDQPGLMPTLRESKKQDAFVGKLLAIEVLCPNCGNDCADPKTGSLMITEDLIGHTVTCVACHTESLVPLNAFSLTTDVVAREKPITSSPNNKTEKRGRTEKPRKSNAGRKAKSGVVRQPRQLSLDVRTIQTLDAMKANNSQLFETLLNQYEPFLNTWTELGYGSSQEDEDE